MSSLYFYGTEFVSLSFNLNFSQGIIFICLLNFRFVLHWIIKIVLLSPNNWTRKYLYATNVSFGLLEKMKNCPELIKWWKDSFFATDILFKCFITWSTQATIISLALIAPQYHFLWTAWNVYMYLSVFGIWWSWEYNLWPLNQ